MMKRKSPNTSRENRLEELGRVDAEKAYTKTGKKNLAAEKRRVVKELEKPMRAAVKGRPTNKTAKMPKRKTK
jgi:hypothetical protein